MDSKTLSSIAIFEEIAVLVATLIILYIKIYDVYEISWWALLYPIGCAIGANIILIFISFILLIIGAFNKNNYEEYEQNPEERG